MVVKQIKRKLRSKTKQQLKNYVMAYLIALVPANYTLTTLTTDLSITDSPMEILNKGFENPLNIISLGAFSPIYNTSKGLIGGVAGMVGADDISLSLIDSANEWFDYESITKNVSEKFDNQLNHSDVVPSDIARLESGEMVESSGNVSEFVSGLTDKIGETLFGKESFNYTDVNTKTYKKGNESVDKYNYEIISDAKIISTVESPDYSPLDVYGRTGKVEDIITYEDVVSRLGKTKQFSPSIVPKGYNLVRNLKGDVGGKQTFLYDRVRLLPYSLGGDNDKENVITGTMSLRTGSDERSGFKYIENKIIEYAKGNKDMRVSYVATPNYLNDSDLIPRTVTVDIKSLDSDSINERVILYNSLYSYQINYDDLYTVKQHI